MIATRMIIAAPCRCAALRGALQKNAHFELLGEAASPARLRATIAVRNPQLVLLNLDWWNECRGFLNPTRPAAPRILLSVETLEDPEVQAAVADGVNGCVVKDADTDTWTRALTAVSAGELWIPRRLVSAALNELRSLCRDRLQPERYEGLTRRQGQILRMATQGLSNKEIGRRLSISPATVKTHLHQIFQRTGVSGRHRLMFPSTADDSSP